MAREEALPGGVEPQFVVDVTAAGVAYGTAAGPTSIDGLTEAIRAAMAYKSSGAPIAVVAIIVAVIALATVPAFLLIVIPAAIVLLIWSHVRDIRGRRVAVQYRLDTAAAKTFEALTNGIGWLQNCHSIWPMTYAGSAHRSADTASVRLPRADAARGSVAPIVTNIEVPSLDAGRQRLLFMPDVLLLIGDSSVIDVPYSAIRVAMEMVQFHESESVPNDSRRIGSSWLYANKNGTPDRRRANNRQIPLVEYGQVTLTWPRGGQVLLVSHVPSTRHFVEAIEHAVQWRAARTEMAAVSKTEVKMPLLPTGPTDLERALQASIDQKRRLEELARHVPAPKPNVAAAEWVAPGRSATVHGLATGDLVYVGEGLQALDGIHVEPSLIDPSLPVDSSHANTSGEGVNYWPAYGTISAASRRAFLEWLDGGRKNPNAYIGYVFIFFYGLERRICDFLQKRATNRDEVLAIAHEVARLQELYARTSGSFRSYAAALLDLIAAVEPRARELTHDVERADFGASRSLKLALGELSLAGKPIPAALALKWVRSCHFLNTPASRCAREFELLFHIRYSKAFGDGLIVKPNKTMIDVSYRPASATLQALTVSDHRLPDITQLSRPLGKLIDVARDCTNALDPFSRFLGKTPEGRQSLAAFALLPEDLVEATPSADASTLASLVQSRLDDSGRASLAAAEVLPYVRIARPDKISKNEAMLLAQALEKLGYGVEPDVRLGGPAYDAHGRVVVFRRLPDCPSTASDEYTTATLCMRLGAAVSAADDDVSEVERTLLQKHIADTLQLSPGERQRLGAHLAWLLEEKPGTQGLKRQLAALTTEARHHIAQLLIIVATTDGHVDPREMKMLEKLYDLIGLDSATLYKDIHAALAGDEPVAVEEPSPAPKGFSIPAQSRPRATTASSIDMDRVRLKIAETRQVSTLLSGIFVEEEAQPAAAVVAGSTIGSLDAAHSEFLRRLVERERWPRGEVERLAGELALMTDGALETINDYAYATAGDALWEDDDPVAINSRVATELTA